MVAILDDVLTLLVPAGLQNYAGLLIGVFVAYKIFEFFKEAVAKK